MPKEFTSNHQNNNNLSHYWAGLDDAVYLGFFHVYEKLCHSPCRIHQMEPSLKPFDQTKQPRFLRLLKAKQTDTLYASNFTQPPSLHTLQKTRPFLFVRLCNDNRKKITTRKTDWNLTSLRNRDKFWCTKTKEITKNKNRGYSRNWSNREEEREREFIFRKEKEEENQHVSEETI